MLFNSKTNNEPWRRYLPRFLRNMPLGWGPVGRELLFVIPIYIVFSLIFTFPLVLNFSDYIPGNLESDVWKHLWGMWWIKYKIFEESAAPLHTHLLNFPYGGALFFIDPLNGLISAPLQFIWEPTIVYNIIVLFNIVLAATGCYCLARYLCGNKYAAFFAGIVYGYSAYMAAYINSGVTEAINIGWIPFFCLFFIRMLHLSSLADAVRAGVFFGIATVGSWYYGAFCVLFAVFFYCYTLFRRYRLYVKETWHKLKAALKWPWSPLVKCWAGIIFCSVVLVHCLPYIVKPFEAVTIHYIMVLVALFGLVIFVCGLSDHKTADISKRIKAFFVLSPWVGIFAWEASIMMNYVKTGTFDGEYDDFMLAQAIAVLLVSIYIIWRYGRRSSLLNAILEPLRGNAETLVSLGLCGLSSVTLLAAVEASPHQGARNVLMASVAVVLSFYVLYKKLHRDAKPYADLATTKNLETYTFEGADFSLWDNYKLFLSSNLGFMAFVALVIIPLLRLLFPTVRLVIFFFLWAAALGLIQLIAAGFLALYIYVNDMARASTSDYQYGLSPYAAFQDFATRMFKKPCVMVLVGAVIIAAPALEFRRTINSDESLVFRRREETNVDIHLSRRFMNVSCLIDFFRPGKGNATVSYTVDKLTRVSYAGWVALFVAALGLSKGSRRRQTGFWLCMALVYMMFALGPFLYITDDIYSKFKSPIYMAFFRYFPLFSQVSIPYRFTTMVMMSLGVLSSFTLASWFRGRKEMDQALFSFGLALAVFFDVAIFSPAPFPIPLSSVRVPNYCQALAEDKSEVGLLDIPIQRYKGELLPGEYFFYQMYHMKAIPNRVEGTIPLFVFQNSFANYLFVLEHAQEDLPPRDQVILEQGLEDLSRFRFRYIVVHNNYLRDSARERMHALLDYYLGKPKEYGDNISVYNVPANLHFEKREIMKSSSADDFTKDRAAKPGGAVGVPAPPPQESDNAVPLPDSNSEVPPILGPMNATE